MGLSEQEQRLLDEMERSLYQHEADIVSTTPSGNTVISARSITIAVLAVAVGLAIIVVGMATSIPLIGLAGFVAMIGGIAWALRSGRQGDEVTADEQPVAAGPRPTSPPKSKPSSGGSFMDRMEDRWERRQDGDH
ncbi:DUF3040 domain-containing protein [Gulosibacter macacae]|uniref:DUF3040 domain-containing protein n=1 Tax=Gulosibacter macacae TaxID=2488791 RepID=A0A3P3VUY0_9MICO|nr:DUF3040 domain-containing protein [Gulosibacter macacae]RRJ86264.1 DUF3040 domain-containing protein [Gulosibacter macacae]